MSHARQTEHGPRDATGDGPPPGDVLCLYSDGVTEAQNAAGEQFDVHRLADVIERNIAEGKALDEVTDAVFDEVEQFSGRHDDDWTLLLAQRS
ncbi:MAG: SpoIIE family protein phosphatase [Polyangiaceae bacterium]